MCNSTLEPWGRFGTNNLNSYSLENATVITEGAMTVLFETAMSEHIAEKVFGKLTDDS